MDLTSDKLKEECGVVAIYSKQHHAIGERLYDALMSLQHRGQESAGMAVWQVDRILHYKNLGLVQEVFDEERIRNLAGSRGIGHVRYSTAGSGERRNAQPLVVDFKGGEMAMAHNGNIINALQIRSEMIDEGHTFNTGIDSEIIIRLIAKHYRGNAMEAIKEATSRIRGAYAMVLMLENKIYGVRDPYALRPLILGQTEDGDYILASESTTLHLLGARVIRDVQKGEILEISEEGVRSEIFDDSKERRLCSFEFVYFSRPDSYLEGQYVFSVRKRMGELLARKDQGEYDLVAPVPDSGIPAAIGYSQGSGIPYTNVLIKNKYIGRTFIHPSQEQRERMLKLKLNILEEELRGKKIVLVDDSIVRGNTMRNLIHQLKEAGAAEVHVRISSPPVIHSCYFGIDTPSKKALIGANFSEDEIRRHIGADSLVYMTPEELREAIGLEGICRACFDGDYPMDVPKVQGKHVFEKF